MTTDNGGLSLAFLCNKIPLVILVYISFFPYYYFQELQLSISASGYSLLKYFPLFLVLCWFLLSFLTKKPKIHGSISIWPFPICTLLMCLIVSLISLKNADYKLIGLVKWFYYNTTGPLLGILIMRQLSDPNTVEKWVYRVTFIAGVVSVYTVVYAALGGDYVWGEVHQANNPYHTFTRASGPFGSPTATASYLLMFFPLISWIVLYGELRFQRILACAFLLLVVAAIIFTYSRSAMLTLGFACMLLFPIWVKILANFKKRKYWLLIALLVTVLVSIYEMGEERLNLHSSELSVRWLHLLQPNSVEIVTAEKVYKYSSLLTYTERFRIAQFYTTLNIIKEFPFFGVGFGNFTRVFDQYKYTDNYIEREFSCHTTDNMYLMYLAETGLIGLFCTLLLFCLLLLSIKRRYNRVEEGKVKDLYWVYIVSVISLMINMFTWDALNEPTIRMCFWLLLGSIFARGTINDKSYQATIG